MSGRAAPDPTDAIRRHAAHEDALAIVTGALVASLGVVLYAKAGLMMGGVAGLALLVGYITPVGFWLGFLTLNLPFLVLGWRRKGAGFVLRTGGAIVIESAFVEGGLRWIEVTAIAPTYAAIVGGVLVGVGLLILFRHDASLGGIGVLALHLQERHGIRAGYVQMTADAIILSAATLVLPAQHLIVSIAGILVLSAVLAVHHRPGRYVGVTRRPMRGGVPAGDPAR